MTRVGGFRFSGIVAGIKKAPSPDVALVAADRPVAAAAVFTTNRVQAAPVVLSRERIRRGTARAIVVNSGNANACTGAQGMADAKAMTAVASRGLGATDREVLVASTGVIGVPLPMDKVVPGVGIAVNDLSEDGFERFARAIMTTDRAMKTHVARAGSIVVAGAAKGAGMIAPQMATTLAFVMTDADVRPAWLRRALRAEADVTFNRVLVDGDTSTNDSLFVLASGAAGNRVIADDGRPGAILRGALREVLDVLSRLLVADGEGAEHVVSIVVEGAPSERAALAVARRIAASPLVKTALYGADPNWGRIVAAAGMAGVPFAPEKVDLHFEDVPIVRAGVGLPASEAAAHAVMKRPEYAIRLHLHAGRASAQVATCDLGHPYVTVNADYRS
jgi:glutamate N-acetyltransferase / amino-acid N-acetyltransferase